MNFNTENSQHGNRVSNQGNGQVQPFSPMNQQRVYFMPTGNMVNIYNGLIHGIWGSNISPVNATSFKKVQIGDMIFLYCSLSGGEDKEKQGFHAVGIIVGKKDPEYKDEITFGDGTYGNIVEVKWLNQPRKDRMLHLTEAQELVPFSKWRWTLQNGQYTNVTSSGWELGSEPLNKLLNRLIVGKSKDELYMERAQKIKSTYKDMLNNHSEHDFTHYTPITEQINNRKHLTYPERNVKTPIVEKVKEPTEDEILKEYYKKKWDFYNRK